MGSVMNLPMAKAQVWRWGISWLQGMGVTLSGGSLRM